VYIVLSRLCIGDQKTLVIIAVLSLFLAPSIAPLVGSAEASRVIVVSGHAGPDGLALVHAVLPPGKYKVVAIKGSINKHLSLPRPLLLSFLPDPSLWERLRSIAVSSVTVSSPTVRLLETSSSVELYVWVSAKPGSEVKVVLEKLGNVGTSDAARNDMVIIVPSDPLLIAAAEKIAKIHRGQGLGVKIVTTDEIYREYREAPRPVTMCKNLPKDYNESLALRILSFIKSLKGGSVHYILLIGDAHDVPPIYYCSPTLRELVSPDEGIVPSDYYYADPDGDGSIDFAVGRIPFSDVASVAAYINSLERWVKGGDWQKRALLAGGAPFATDLFVGEAAVTSTIPYIGSLGLNVSELLLSLPGYSGTSLAAFLGNYGLYYVVTHGTGSAMLDYVPGGIWNYDFQEKLNARQVPYTPRPGVFVTPACRVAYWDYDLFDPPFTPPSIAAAMLERGAAIAFIGSTRVAVEAIDAAYFGLQGTEVSLAGADAPLQLFFKMLPGSSTIGEAWRKALNAYLSSPKSMYRVYLTSGEEEIGSLVVHELAFLGDPAIPNPWKEAKGAEAEKPLMTSPLGSLQVDAAIAAMPLARYVTGSITAYNPGPSTTVSFTIESGCPSILEAQGLVRIEGYVLIGLESLETNATALGSNECHVTLKVPLDAPGLLRVVAIWNDTATAYYLAVGGAYLDKDGATVVFRGLDVLETIGDEPIAVAVNNTLRSLVPGGSTNYNVSLPVLGSPSGYVTVSAKPIYRYDLIFGGKAIADAMRILAKLYTVNVTMRHHALPLSPALAPPMNQSNPLLPIIVAGGESTPTSTANESTNVCSCSNYFVALILLAALVTVLQVLQLFARSK
jgi:hypothetical protein